MRIGSVREIKKFEYRVGLTPDNVKSYVNAGHQVYIERNAGVGSGFMTEDYVKAGATILETMHERSGKLPKCCQGKRTSFL